MNKGPLGWERAVVAGREGVKGRREVNDCSPVPAFNVKYDFHKWHYLFPGPICTSKLLLVGNHLLTT